MKCDEETKAKAIRPVVDHAEDHSSEYEAIRTVPGRLEMNGETLRKLLRWVEVDAKERDGVEHIRRGRIPLLIVGEVGYIPFEAEAVNLFFQLVSARYERVSVIVTFSKPFGRWGEVFCDPVVAAAMIDRLVHHAEVVSRPGGSIFRRFWHAYPMAPGW